MTKRSIAVVLSCSLLGCATPRHLARVNDDVVDGQDLKAEFVRRHGGHQRFLTADEYIVRRFLDATIDRRLLLQEAYRIGLQDADDVRESTAEFKLRKQVEQLVRTEIQEKVVPTDEEIRAAYDTRTEDIYLVRQIVAKERADAEAIRAELQGGADFEALARAKSVADSRKFGGLIPEVAWGAKTPEWEAAVFALEPGQFTAVVETDAGYEILRLESKRKAEKPPFDKAAARIRTILQQRKLQDRRREFLEEMWKKHGATTAPFDRIVEALRAGRDAKDPRVIASWNGGKITLGEFAAGFDLEAMSRLSAAKLAQALDQELQGVVNEGVIKAEAAARGDALLTEAALREIRDHREGLMENRLYGEHVFRQVVVTDEDVKAYYEAHRDEFTLPEARHVAHVAVETSEAAEEVKQALAAGTPFDELVRTRSKDPAAATTNGDLGWITRKDAPGELGAIFDAKAGEAIGPVKTKFGYHVVKVLEVAPPRTPPLEEVAAEVRKKAHRAKNQEKRDDWVKQLRASARISVSERAVRKFLKEGQAEMERAGAEAPPPSHGPHMPGVPQLGHGGGAIMPPGPMVAPAAPTSDAAPPAGSAAKVEAPPSK